MNHSRPGLRLAVCVATMAAALVAVPAYAAADLQDPTGSFDGLLQLVQQSSASWAPKLQGYATTLFWLLAVMQFVWSMGMLAFKQPDFGELFGELLRQIMTIGFWAAFLMFSVEWNTAIIDSFREAGAAAAGQGKAMVPGDMFTLAVQFATKIAQSGAGLASPLNPFAQVLTSISSIIVLLCFAFIAVLMGLALMESYIVVNAGVLMMGFAGASWTRDMTVQFLKYGVSVGAKLFVLTLLVGLIKQASTAWAAAYDPLSADGSSTFTLLGLALACAYFCKTIPELIQGVIAGTSPGGGGAIGGIAAAGIAAAAATAAVAKTIATGGMAAPVAAKAIGDAASSAGSASGLGGSGALMSTAGEAGEAGEGASRSLADLGSGIGGETSSAQKSGLGTEPAAPESNDGGSGSSASTAGDDAGPSASNDEAYDADGAELPDSDTANSGDAADGPEADAPQQKPREGLGSMFETMRHSGRSAFAAAAMVTPGMDVNPSADGLYGGPGDIKTDNDKDAGADAPAAPAAQENVIMPGPADGAQKPPQKD